MCILLMCPNIRAKYLRNPIIFTETRNDEMLSLIIGFNCFRYEESGAGCGTR